MAKTKKVKQIRAKETMDYWKTVAGRIGNVIRVYWCNGEHHVKGTWADTGEAFDLPHIFFEDVK